MRSIRILADAVRAATNVTRIATPPVVWVLHASPAMWPRAHEVKSMQKKFVAVESGSNMVVVILQVAAQVGSPSVTAAAHAD